jgi:hypothetical protein
LGGSRKTEAREHHVALVVALIGLARHGTRREQRPAQPLRLVVRSSVTASGRAHQRRRAPPACRSSTFEARPS